MAALLLCAALAPAATAQGLAAPAPGAAAPAAAQGEVSPLAVYRREVFAYQRGGRPDPFQPLLSAADLGYRVEDLRLTSIIYSPDPRMSVAVFALADSSNRFRLRAGQRLGTITVMAIYPRRVDLRVEDFGVPRIESVTLQRPGPQNAAGATPTAPAGAPGTAPGQGPVRAVRAATGQQVPAQQQAPSGPLRRGGRTPATPAAPAPTTTRPRPSGASPNP